MFQIAKVPIFQAVGMDIWKKMGTKESRRRRTLAADNCELGPAALTSFVGKTRSHVLIAG